MGLPSSGSILLKIVIIDNDAENLELLRGALKTQPVEVVTTTAEGEGLNLVRSKRPHVVLLGVDTQTLGGIPTLDRILEMDPSSPWRNPVLLRGGICI